VGLRPRERAVAAIEARRMRQVLPSADRVPPETLRAMTNGRRLRSAVLLVCGTPGTATKVKGSWR
jgi:hypothetical protein